LLNPIDWVILANVIGNSNRNGGNTVNYTNALSTEQLQRYVPSAFAAQPYHAQSSRYAFIPTSAVIEGMRSAGFVPVMASQSRTRIEDKRGFTKHMIRFRPSGSLQAQAVVGDSVLEAVLINSHDGTSAYKLMCGVYRFVCSNGMVVADTVLESINIRHTGRVIDEVIEGSGRILESAPAVLNTIESWKTLELAPVEQKLLAETAHSLRFPVDEETGKAATEVTPDMLLRARRSDDIKPDLWHTFNRIQENSVKGVRTWANHHRVSSRAVKGIDGDVKLNRALWTLAEKMAELKAA
jgi:hypothetical protein